MIKRTLDVYRPLHQKPNKGEWIPVTERLPENNEIVLFQGKYGGMYVGKYMGSCGFRIWSDAEGYKKQGCVAWMPLPEPYKEGDKE